MGRQAANRWAAKRPRVGRQAARSGSLLQDPLLRIPFQDPSTRLVLMGPAGAGKTVLASCILRAWAEKGTVVFVDGFRLAVARAQVSLGDEAPLVTRALRARALVVDDLLAKPGTAIHDATSDVIFERHQRMRRTVVTTGFDLEQIKARLGDGIARRIFEGATVIELKPRSS